MHRSSKTETVGFLRSCPFCPGNENMATPAVLEYITDSSKGGWRVRVFSNKFPAVTPDAGNFRKVEQNMFLSLDAWGHHEVIVESPTHNKHIALMNDTEVSDVLSAYRDRYTALAQTPNVKSIIIFKNHGLAAGTSVEHPHSQLVATTIVPRHMRIKYDVAISYYDDNSHCLYADLRDSELEAGTRLITATAKFVVFHPFASHRPFETWIMPLANQASFSQIGDEDMHYLAKVLRITLLKLHRGLENPDFNLVIENSPVGEEHADFYLWHIKIIPRLTETAGFEIGSGIFINTALPEETARFMRDVEV